MTFACKSKDDSATTFSEVDFLYNQRVYNIYISTCGLQHQDVGTSHFATGK